MNEQINSIRMRAQKGDKHISGAERLVAIDELETVAVDMLQRALTHSRGQAAKIYFRVDSVKPEQVTYGKLPDLHNNQVCSWQQGRDLAAEMLSSYGISELAINNTFDSLQKGPTPEGTSMRGAMLIDAATGERLEADPFRGVRVSRMDLTLEARTQLTTLLEQHSLNNTHVVEALTLASKVISAPSVIAELCWSDDPHYTAGYVASAQGGYQRISEMKPVGEERGGRAFFVLCGRGRLGRLVSWLENVPFLIDRIGRIHEPRHWIE